MSVTTKPNGTDASGAVARGRAASAGRRAAEAAPSPGRRCWCRSPPIVLGSRAGPVVVDRRPGTTTEVLAVRTLVHRGEVIDRDDLMVVRVGLDPAVKTVPAAQAGRGRRPAGRARPGAGRAARPRTTLAATVLPGQGHVGGGHRPGAGHAAGRAARARAMRCGSCRPPASRARWPAPR